MGPNYGLMGEMAGGIKEGLIAYQTNKNIQRNNQMQNMQMGMQQNPETGLLERTPEAEQQHQMQIQSQQSDFNKTQQGRDPNSVRSKTARGLLKSFGVSDVPDSATEEDLKDFLPLASAKIKGDNSMGMMNARFDLNQGNVDRRADQQSERIHNQNLKDLNDPTTTQLMNTYNNLQNAKQNFEKGGATPQEFSELQQAVRSNIGLKGNSGIGEREETYLKSLGISADKVKQFFTGDPQSVLQSDPAFSKQILGLVDLEAANKQKQVYGQVMKKASGHKSFYGKTGNESRSDDFNNAVESQLNQLGIDKSGKPLEGQSGASNQQYSPDVLNYAAKFKVSPAQAQAYKDQHNNTPAAPQQADQEQGLLGKIKGLFGG